MERKYDEKDLMGWNKEGEITLQLCHGQNRLSKRFLFLYIYLSIDNNLEQWEEKAN